MTAEYTEDPSSGYFNCWTGRYPRTCVRTLDLYMVWRDHEVVPPLAELPNLVALIVPSDLMTRELAEEAAQTGVVHLAITMHEAPSPPDAIFELPALESLDLHGCRVEQLPDRFADLPGLTRVDLGMNDLRALPASLLAAPRLTDLDVSYNRLAAPPAFPRGCPLQRLDLGVNPISRLDCADLPRGLTDLSALAALESAPAGLAALTGLRRLALGNKLTDLPDLTALPRLADLTLAGRFSDALFDRLPASLTALRGWGSHLLGLTRVPPGIARLTNLTTLELNFERLTELAPELAAVPLVELHLSSTTLADTPTYAHLPATLKILHLANVGMTRCPERLADLKLLEELVLTNNPMPEVPEAVRQLPNLRKLEFRRKV